MIGGMLLSFLLGILLCFSFSDKAPEKVYIEVEKNVSVPCEEVDNFLTQELFETKKAANEIQKVSRQKLSYGQKNKEVFIEESKEGEYLLASEIESQGKYKISLISVIPPKKMTDKESDYFPLPVTIHGKMGEEGKFILNTVVDISKYANDIRLKVTKIEDTLSEEIVADFLYGVTIAGDYEMEISVEPLNVLYFNLIEEVNREIFRKPTKEKMDKIFENTNFLKR